MARRGNSNHQQQYKQKVTGRVNDSSVEEFVENFENPNTLINSNINTQKRRTVLKGLTLDNNFIANSRDIMLSHSSSGDLSHHRSSSSLDGVFNVITDFYSKEGNGEVSSSVDEENIVENPSTLHQSEQQEIIVKTTTTTPDLDGSDHSIHNEDSRLVETTPNAQPEKLGDYEKFVYKINPKFEKYWETFDDKIISIIQMKPNKVFFLLSMIVTVFTTIEIGILAPFVLYLFGIDQFACFAMWVIFTLAMLSQLPKRFLFRKRPYLAGRALKIAKDKTSSFPSRAVTCSVVYSFLVCYFVRSIVNGESMSDVIFWSWCIPCCMLSALASSCARIYLGVHYPSDCLFGVLQGLTSILIGSLMYLFHLGVLCPPCNGGGSSLLFSLMPCYAPAQNSVSLVSLGAQNMENINWFLFVILSVGSLGLGILFVIKPLQFYTKFHHVFSLIAPCLTFQYCFICPRLSLDGITTVKSPILPPEWFDYLYALIAAIVFTIAGMKSPKKYSLIAFCILYLLVFSSLFFWRACQK